MTITNIITMDTCTNWSTLVRIVSENQSTVFQKLLFKINQYLRHVQKSEEKSNRIFNPNDEIGLNHMDTFNNFKLMYEQLVLEDDTTDIFVEIPSLTATMLITFNLVSVGKWIKMHSGNTTRIFFFDEEKTIISDNMLADFLNRLHNVKNGYRYYSLEPKIYYKFKILPEQDIIDYLAERGIIAIGLDQKTPPFVLPPISSDKVLLDQTVLLTLCSNLSNGLSESFYTAVEQSRGGFIKTKEALMKNKDNIDAYLANKRLIVSRFVYESSKTKIEAMAGPTEKAYFYDICKQIEIVPDEINPRFTRLNEIEIIYASVAERECCIIVTANMKLANKLSAYYNEILYKLFYGAQLAECKYA